MDLRTARHAEDMAPRLPTLRLSFLLGARLVFGFVWHPRQDAAKVGLGSLPIPQIALPKILRAGWMGAPQQLGYVPNPLIEPRGQLWQRR